MSEAGTQRFGGQHLGDPIIAAALPKYRRKWAVLIESIDNTRMILPHIQPT